MLGLFLIWREIDHGPGHERPRSLTAERRPTHHAARHLVLHRRRHGRHVRRARRLRPRRRHRPPRCRPHEAERRAVLKSIGPVWDGNEVWLLAGGGALYFAFPALYASSFTGFYLPLMMVLWLLILRGTAVEFRSHIDNQRLAALLGRRVLQSPARCWPSSSAPRWATSSAACPWTPPATSSCPSGPTSSRVRIPAFWTGTPSWSASSPS